MCYIKPIPNSKEVTLQVVVFIEQCAQHALLLTTFYLPNKDTGGQITQNEGVGNIFKTQMYTVYVMKIWTI